MMFTTVACQSFFLRRVVEMEKESNKIKSKYVGLLSDKFKIALPSEFLGPLAVGGGLLVILSLPPSSHPLFTHSLPLLPDAPSYSSPSLLSTLLLAYFPSLLSSSSLCSRPPS